MGAGLHVQPVRVLLPGGLWRDSGDEAPVREVCLRAVGDADRAFLLETLDTLPAAERATALLARCVTGESLTDAALVAGLTAGDREALLLHLHRLTFGDTMDCVLSCPAPQCNRQMELAPRVADLLTPPYEETQRGYEIETTVADSAYRLCFRLPIAADLAAIAPIAARDVEQGASALLQRCVSAASRDDVPVSVAALPAEVRDVIAEEMARRDAQAELELDLRCPSCGLQFAVVLDAASFLLQELDAQAVQTLQEVHLLASQYGWHENEILRMPAARRARYLDLIATSQARTRTR